MLFSFWASVTDGEPKLNQHWLNVFYLQDGSSYEKRQENPQLKVLGY